MRKEHRGAVLGPIRALYSVGTLAGLGDGQLIERFIARQGEAAELAFAALVERHGPMVLRVCRRLLNDSNDAEDAFQATFVILVRKAGSLRDRGSVGAWLHGVAARVARDARAASDRRRRHEKRYAETIEGWALAETLDRQDLERAVQLELERLPERYREPLVLCCLEGLSHEEAARRLERPVGTIRSRLARGRERLRGGLLRRGCSPTPAMLVGALSREAAMVPESLFDLTVRSAARVAAGEKIAAGVVSVSVAHLTRVTLRSMFMVKLKYAIVAAAAIGVTTTAGVSAYQDLPKTAAANFPLGQNPAGGGTVAKTSGRVAAAEEHLEHTKKQVDDAVTDLRSEVEDLRARLKQAEAVLARMEALQSALGTNPGDHAPGKGFGSFSPANRGGANGYGGAASYFGRQGYGANQGQQPAKAANSPSGADPFGKGAGGGAFFGSASAKPGSNETSAITNRRKAIDDEINRLIQERESLISGRADNAQSKRP